MAPSLMPGGMVQVFHKLYKNPASSGSLSENTLLMPEVNGEFSNCFKQIVREQQLK